MRSLGPLAFCITLLACIQVSAGQAVAAVDGPPGGPDDAGTALRIVDHGFGPGVSPDGFGQKLRRLVADLVPSAAPLGGPDAAAKGAFSAPVSWPILAVHAVMMPDGRVLTYGPHYAQPFEPQLVYDIWDPALGRDAASHFLLPNTTATEIFCGAQALMGGTGEVLLAGGDQTVGGRINYSHRKTALFSPRTNLMRPAAPMIHKRWYATLVALPYGSMLALGGRRNQDPDDPVTVPEIFTPSGGWRLLAGGDSEAAFGSTGGKNWYYPRGFVAPNGKVFVLSHTGAMFYLTTTGRGGISRLAPTIAGANEVLPTLMYAPGKILAVRKQGRVALVDLNPGTPAVSYTNGMSEGRLHANATVLADGRVLVNGGSANWNRLEGAAYRAEIWNPATGLWTLGASAAKARLYHSTSLLLRNGTVLTAGGGEPGPVFNLNAEIYYPPYLFADDGSGRLAARPTLAGVPATVRLGQTIGATVGATDRISRVTLVRTGSATHALNADQRFKELTFSQAGGSLTIAAPLSPRVAPAGYYMLFVFNNAGVPSVSRIIRLTA